MRRMRTRLLLGAIACLVLATPFATPLAAQMSPSVSGETGLFQVTNAEMLPQGRFSLGLSGDCGIGRRRPFPLRPRFRTIPFATTSSGSAVPSRTVSSPDGRPR